MTEWKPEKMVTLTAEELAQAIVDVRNINYGHLAQDRGVANMKRKGMTTEVRPMDIEYAKVLIRRITRNRGDVRS